LASWNIRIKDTNAAFDENPAGEVARILRELADRIESRGDEGRIPLMDINGNTVGECYCQGILKRRY
jgi:hypothetical protein